MSRLLPQKNWLWVLVLLISGSCFLGGSFVHIWAGEVGLKGFFKKTSGKENYHSRGTLRGVEGMEENPGETVVSRGGHGRTVGVQPAGGSYSLEDPSQSRKDGWFAGFERFFRRTFIPNKKSSAHTEQISPPISSGGVWKVNPDSPSLGHKYRSPPKEKTSQVHVR